MSSIINYIQRQKKNRKLSSKVWDLQVIKFFFFLSYFNYSSSMIQTTNDLSERSFSFIFQYWQVWQQLLSKLSIILLVFNQSLLKWSWREYILLHYFMDRLIIQFTVIWIRSIFLWKHVLLTSIIQDKAGNFLSDAKYYQK